MLELCNFLDGQSGISVHGSAGNGSIAIGPGSEVLITENAQVHRVGINRSHTNQGCTVI